MSGSGRGGSGMKLAAGLVRKGATILGEPCPKCGGIRVSYRGRVYCTSHEDLSTVMATEPPSVATVVVAVREAVLAKLSEASLALGQEKDSVKQEQLVSLMTRCYELLQRISQDNRGLKS